VKPLVLDTNVVLDLLVFGDAAAQPVKQGLQDGALRWLATHAMREELARVLAYPKLAPRVAFHRGDAQAVLGDFDRHARLLEAREGLDHGLPALEQLALADFIERGAYDRHIRRSARAYRRRRDALLDALAISLPDASVSGAAAGLHVAVHVPGADEGALVAACREQGVILDGAAQHGTYGDGATLLISFAAVPDAAAGHVVELIARADGRR